MKLQEEMEQKVNGQFHIRAIGTHLLITSAAFDHELLEMPHQSLSVVFNVETSDYVCRSWGREVDRGSFYELDPLVDFCLTLFKKSGCIGITPPDRNFPLSCQFSANCSNFVIGSSRCAACVAEKESPLIKAENFPSGFEALATKQEMDEPLVHLDLPADDVKSDDSGGEEDVKLDGSDAEDLKLDGSDAEDLKLDGSDAEDVKPSDILELLIDTNANTDISTLFTPKDQRKRSYAKKPKEEPQAKRKKRKLKSSECEICGSSFGCRKTLWRHKVMDHGQGKFKCHVCSERISLASELLAHIHEAHPGVDTAHCPKCSEIIQFDSDPESFPIHYLACMKRPKLETKERMKIRVLKNRIPCTCDECGKTFSNLTSLRSHQKIHKGLGEVCKECGYVAPHRSMLAGHMEKHLRERGELETMLCSVCGDPFQGKQSLWHHVSRKHKEYECGECGEKVIGHDNLNAHKANVHVVNKCKICQAGFATPFVLKRHMEVHIEPMIKCRFCDRMFKRRDGVVNHERTHTGETPFACNLCPYVCKSSATLCLHKKFKHNGGRRKVSQTLE